MPEINVEIPDETPDESDNDSSDESVAVAAGEAIASAENAEANADEANETADEANETADEAKEMAQTVFEDNQQLGNAVHDLTMAVAALGSELVEQKKVLETIASNTAPSAPVIEPDTPPENRHWLHKRIGGGQ